MYFSVSTQLVVLLLCWQKLMLSVGGGSNLIQKHIRNPETNILGTAILCNPSPAIEWFPSNSVAAALEHKIINAVVPNYQLLRRRLL
jgi:hypothetical protein